MIAEPYICGAEGCKRRAIARGWCHMHYQRWHAKNPILNFREAVYAENDRNGTTLIPLTKGAVAQVSPEDYEPLRKFKWHLTSAGYAARRIGRHGPTVLMHQMIVTDGEPDHENRDRLDNRRENLRPSTRSLNNSNKLKKEGATSRFKGVCRIVGTNRWQASIQFNKKRYSLGEFREEEHAAIVYNVAAQMCFGPFAVLNPI